MPINLESFAINGIDVSSFQGLMDWSKPKCDFAAIRVGYGNTIDPQFKNNWVNSKSKVNRIPYWYMDYYSNWWNKLSPAYGMGDVAWGRKQADNCWNAIKHDPSCRVFLDIENGGKDYSTPLTDPETKRHALAIAQAFLERMDELNGLLNGIYTSMGWLGWFTDWFKNRPLWVAWYNENVSIETVLYSANTGYKWRGVVVIWQYASHGDINGDGVKDGVAWGAKTEDLDLNGWIASPAVYALYFGIDEEDDDVVVIPVPTQKERTIPVKKVKPNTYLRLRTSPNARIFTNIIRNLDPNTEVDCLEKFTEGDNIWWRIGFEKQFVAERYNGDVFLE